MSPTEREDRVGRLTAEVRKAPKARAVHPPFIARRCALEIERRGGTDREIVKRVKRTLHQVGGAYLTPAPRYGRLLDQLAAAEPGSERVAVARRLVTAHASMRERAADLDRYYAALFDGLGERGTGDGEVPAGLTVLDLACGLNPLARPLMPVAIDRYVACDLYLDLLDFVAAGSALLGHPVETFPADLATDPADSGLGPTGPPPSGADVVLLLKTLPCLDQLDPDAGRRLLAALAVGGRHVLVTYPVQSLGGAEKGMREHYAASFQALVATLARATPVEFEITELELPAELGYRLTFLARATAHGLGSP